MKRLQVTIDTSALPADDLIRVLGGSVDFVVTTVAVREVAGTSFAVEVDALNRVAEAPVWDESSWDESEFDDDGPLEDILHIISSGAFPSVGQRQALTNGQAHQLRDAMALEAHLRAKRDVFLTEDCRAFINGDRRTVLEREFSTRIMTTSELHEFVHAASHDSA